MHSFKKESARNRVTQKHSMRSLSISVSLLLTGHRVKLTHCIMILLLLLAAPAFALYGVEIGNEQQTTDWASMIGGSFVGAVQAQTRALDTMRNMIDEVCTTQDGFMRDVTFEYMKPSPSGANATRRRLTIPIIALAPIPIMKIEELVITFDAKITAMTSSEESPGRSTPLTYSGSFARKTPLQTNTVMKQDYHMRLEIRGRQADQPEGLHKLVEVLGDNGIVSYVTFPPVK